MIHTLAEFYLEMILHPKDKPYLFMLCSYFGMTLYCLLAVCEDFTSMFFSDVTLQFSFLMVSWVLNWY